MNKNLQVQTLDNMIDSGAFSYGDVIDRDEFLSTFGVKRLGDTELCDLTPLQMREHFKSEDLEELAVVDRVRTKLLSIGRYFKKENNNYRVCLPSENASIADSYMKQAQRKIGKGRKLLAGTAPEFVEHTNTGSRLLLAENSAKTMTQ